MRNKLLQYDRNKYGNNNFVLVIFKGMSDGLTVSQNKIKEWCKTNEDIYLSTIPVQYLYNVTLPASQRAKQKAFVKLLKKQGETELYELYET